jgi:hypothetical protein
MDNMTPMTALLAFPGGVQYDGGASCMGLLLTRVSRVRYTPGAVAAAPRPFLPFNPGARRAEASRPGCPCESATASRL